jgi:hypothetical protein
MAMSLVAANIAPIIKIMAAAFIPQGKGVIIAQSRKSEAIIACIIIIHHRLVKKRSICGAQKNFKIQGRPKNAVSPIDSRLTFLVLK